MVSHRPVFVDGAVSVVCDSETPAPSGEFAGHRDGGHGGTFAAGVEHRPTVVQAPVGGLGAGAYRRGDRATVHAHRLGRCPQGFAVALSCDTRPNAYPERWVRTAHRECLDRVLIYNPRHLLAVLGQYVTHYNDHRPHQGRRQLPPTADAVSTLTGDLIAARIRDRKILNGLINEYSQAV
jgi:hypothetical protein